MLKIRLSHDEFQERINRREARTARINRSPMGIENHCASPAVQATRRALRKVPRPLAIVSRGVGGSFVAWIPVETIEAKVEQANNGNSDE